MYTTQPPKTMVISVIMINQPNKTVFEEDTLTATMNADNMFNILTSIQNMFLMNFVR